MLESLHTTAQLTTFVEADITGIAQLRAAEKDDFARRTGTKLSYLPFFAKAAVEALNEYPLLNSTVNAAATEITYHDAWTPASVPPNSDKPARPARRCRSAWVTRCRTP